MDDKKKKIIAREYIMLMIILLIGALTYLSTVLYNVILQNKIDKVNERIEINNSQIDTLIQIYRQKSNNQDSLYKKFKEEFDVSHLKTKDAFWTRTEHVARIDSFSILWKTKWDKSIISAIQNMGFLTPDDLKSFIIDNSYTLDDLKNDSTATEIKKYNVDLLNNLSLKKGKILTRRDQIKIAVSILIISFILLFIIRYLIILLRWSIKTLKN
jgi:hypothetical protein